MLRARLHRQAHGIRELCSNNLLDQALELAHSHVRDGVPLQTAELYSLLDACITRRDLAGGRQVHSLIKFSSLQSSAFLGSHLIRLYGLCGTSGEADDAFDRIFEPNVFVWSAIISAHANFGNAEKAMELFWRMQSSGVRPDKYVFVALLKACSQSQDFKQGSLVHSYIVETSLESDRFICSILVDMYSNCASLSDAHQVLAYLQSKDVVAWNAIILSYAENGYYDEAIMLFKQMQQEGVELNSASFLSILKAFCSSKRICEGIRVHVSIMQSGLLLDQSLCNALIDMYVKAGCLKLALVLFDEHPSRDVVAWNTIITGLSQAGRMKDAFALFDRMRQVGIKPNIMTWNSVIAGHAQCGLCREAIWLFGAMRQEDLTPDIVTWNSLLGGLSHHGEGKLALNLFNQMLNADIEPSIATFLATLKASSNTASLFDGHSFHSYIIENKLESDIMIASALIDMYSNCRCLKHAFSVFERVHAHNVFTWSALIAGLVQNNEYKRALHVFTNMQREGCKPNEVTFVSVLSACCGAGFIDEGYSYFALMQDCYGFLPTLEHFNCLGKLFGGFGCMLEAKHMLVSIPFEHNVVGWTALLSNCRKHGQDVRYL